MAGWFGAMMRKVAYHGLRATEPLRCPAEARLRKHRAIILWRGVLVAAVAGSHFPPFLGSDHDAPRLSKDLVHP